MSKIVNNKKLDKLDLTVIMQRVAEDNPELTAFELHNAEVEYRNYLKLVSLYPGKGLAPTGLADKVWHAHILFTVRYAADCEQHFGYFLHHNPFDDNTPAAHRRRRHALTQKLYTRHFGALPQVGSWKLGSCDDCNYGPPTRKTPPVPGRRGPAPGGHDRSQTTVN
jgi:hypothetical protein